MGHVPGEVHTEETETEEEIVEAVQFNLDEFVKDNGLEIVSEGEPEPIAPVLKVQDLEDTDTEPQTEVESESEAEAEAETVAETVTEDADADADADLEAETRVLVEDSVVKMLVEGTTEDTMEETSGEMDTEEVQPVASVDDLVKDA